LLSMHRVQRLLIWEQGGAFHQIPAKCVRHSFSVHVKQKSRCSLLKGFSRKAFDDIVEADLPLVVCVAWLGAQERHFRKYTQMWQAMGCPTLSIRPQTSSIVFPPLGDRQARSFLRELEGVREAHAGRHMLLHVFSNAGFLFAGTALRLSARASKQGEVASCPLELACGVIFDSAPARLTPDMAARGFVSAGLGKPAKGIQHSRPRSVAAATSIFKIFLNAPYIAARSDEVWEAWRTTAPLCPQLYMYSTDDVLIPQNEIRSFQESQRERGVDVRERIWTDSAHCEHYRRYPEEYVSQLKEFVHLASQGEAESKVAGAAGEST